MCARATLCLPSLGLQTRKSPRRASVRLCPISLLCLSLESARTKSWLMPSLVLHSKSMNTARVSFGTSQLTPTRGDWLRSDQPGGDPAAAREDADRRGEGHHRTARQRLCSRVVISRERLWSRATRTGPNPAIGPRAGGYIARRSREEAPRTPRISPRGVVDPEAGSSSRRPSRSRGRGPSRGA